MTEAQKPRLLIAEDEEVLRGSLVGHLSDELDIEIVEAASGDEALEKFEQQECDAILTDISMPGMSGLEFVQKIREKGYDTPFLILTAYKNGDNLTDALRLGAKEFLEKPVNFEEMTTVVRGTLEFGQTLRLARLELDELCERSNLHGDELKNFRENYYDKITKERIYALEKRKKLGRYRIIKK